MALIVADRILETTSTTGTGSLTLIGAIAGYQSFAAIGNANTTYYTIVSGTDWETGIGTYTSSGTTLSRDTVLASSAGGTTKIAVTPNATVFCDYPASKAVYKDASDIVTVPTLNLTNPLSLANGGTGKTTATAALANLQGYTTTANFSLATTAATGDGTTATLTFAVQGSPPFAVGSTIFVAGVTPSGYNTATGALVTACTTTTVSYLNATSAVQTVAGTVTAAPVLTNTSSYYQLFTGTTIGAVILPVASTLQLGWSYRIYNASSQALTVYSSGGNSILAITPNAGGTFTCIDTTLTTAAAWRQSLSDFGVSTGTSGSVVLSVSPTITGTLGFTGTSTSGANFASGQTTGSTNIVTIQTTGITTIGGTATTGALILGRSTGSQYIDIANGATTSSTTASGTASSISTTVLTVGGTVTGTFVVGMQLTGTNVLPNTYITTLGTGTGGAGTYNISQTQTVASTTITGTTQKTVNIGTAGVSGSSTIIKLGSAVAGSTGTTTIQTSTVVLGQNATSVNYIQAQGNATGVAPVVSAQGTDTDIPLVLQPKGTGALQAQATTSTATGGNARGANAVDLQTSRSSATAVASGQYSFIGGGNANSATSFGTISMGLGNGASGFGAATLSGNNNSNSSTYSVITGGQNNVCSSYLGFVGSGLSNTAAGYYNFIGAGFTNSGTSGSAVTTQSGTMNATTAVTLSGSNANIKVGQYITGTSIAAETYVAAISGTALTLSKVASGSSTSTLSFYTPHGVVVGGGNNQATGSYSFIGGGGDAGTAANRNVASGDWSVVAGGFKNTASGLGSFVGGGGWLSQGSAGSGNSASNTCSTVLNGAQSGASGAFATVINGTYQNASGTYSTVATGSGGTSRSIQCSHVVSGIFASNVGDAQAGTLVIRSSTTDATATALTVSGVASGTNQVILPNNSAYFFTGEVISGKTGGGDTKGWTIEGVIKRGANAASTALVGTPTVTSTYADAGASTWVIAVTADTTNGGIRVTFTGQAATTIRTVCQIRTTEMTY